MASFIARYSQDMDTFKSKTQKFNHSIGIYISNEFGGVDHSRKNGEPGENFEFKLTSKNNGDYVIFRSLGDITKERIYEVEVSGSKEERVSEELKKILKKYSFLIE